MEDPAAADLAEAQEVEASAVAEALAVDLVEDITIITDRIFTAPITTAAGGDADITAEEAASADFSV